MSDVSVAERVEFRIVHEVIDFARHAVLIVLQVTEDAVPRLCSASAKMKKKTHERAESSVEACHQARRLGGNRDERTIFHNNNNKRQTRYLVLKKVVELRADALYVLCT